MAGNGKGLSSFAEFKFREKARARESNPVHTDNNLEWQMKSRDRSEAGLPDVLFSDQKYKLGHIFEGLGMENVGLFYGRLVSCMTIGIKYGWSEGG
jgi:hypothetical protein